VSCAASLSITLIFSFLKVFKKSWILPYPVVWSPVHTGNKVDCCRNRRQIGDKVDCRRIRSTLLPVLATNRQQLEFDCLSPSTLSPTRSTLSPKTVDFVADTVDSVARMSNVLSTLSPVCTGPQNFSFLQLLACNEKFKIESVKIGQRWPKDKTCKKYW